LLQHLDLPSSPDLTGKSEYWDLAWLWRHRWPVRIALSTYRSALPVWGRVVPRMPPTNWADSPITTPQATQYPICQNSI